MNTNKNIYKKLMEVQAELKCGKTQKNTFGNYYYRSCEDIIEAVKPLLSQKGLVLNISDSVEMVGDRIYIKATVRVINIEDGQVIENTALAREELTKKGMDASQITGTASSYARKYALNGMFAIDDTKDADSLNTHGKEVESGISEKQLKRLYAIAGSKGYNDRVVNKAILRDYALTEPLKMNKTQYDDICKKFEEIEAKA